MSESVTMVVLQRGSVRSPTSMTGPAGVPAVSAGYEELVDLLASVATDWVVLAPDSCSLDPSWLPKASPYLRDTSVGCFGGRVLVVDGPQVAAPWFDPDDPVAWFDGLGVPHSRLDQIPFRPSVRDVPFLRTEGLTVRTGIAKAAAERGVLCGSGPGEYGLAAIAHSRGLRVSYDSRLVCAVKPSEPDAHDMECGATSLMVGLRLNETTTRLAAALLIGGRRSPGVVLAPAYLVSKRRRQRWIATIRGKIRGMTA